MAGDRARNIQAPWSARPRPKKIRSISCAETGACLRKNIFSVGASFASLRDTIPGANKFHKQPWNEKIRRRQHVLRFQVVINMQIV